MQSGTARDEQVETATESASQHEFQYTLLSLCVCVLTTRQGLELCEGGTTTFIGGLLVELDAEDDCTSSVHSMLFLS